MRQRKKWTAEQKAEASRKAKERAAQMGGSTVLETQETLMQDSIINEGPTLEQVMAENERLKATIAQQTLGMTVAKEEEPLTPAKFLDNEQWHYYLCIKSKADEEDEEAEKCSKDPLRGGYEVAPGGRLSARKVWLRIPQALFKSRKQGAVDEARSRWLRPEGQDVRDGLIQKRDQQEQFVKAGQPAGVA